MPDRPLPTDLLAMQRVAQLLDRAVTIPGTGRHVGLDALMGLIPGVGDLMGAGISLWIVYSALRHRVPMPKVLRMLWHVAVDALAGAVPILGDVFDVFWEGNTRNAEIVMRYRDASLPPRRPEEVLGVMSLISVVVLAFVALVVTTLVAAVIALFRAAF